MEGRDASAAGAGWSVSRRTADVAVGVVAFLVGVAVIYDSYQLGSSWEGGSPESGYFPFRIGVIICIVSAVIVLRTLWRSRGRAPEVFVTWQRFRLVLAVLVPTLAYILAIAFLGIYAASALFIAGFMRASRQFGWLKSAAVGAATAAVLFWMFEIQFLVPLPKGPLEAWLGY